MYAFAMETYSPEARQEFLEELTMPMDPMEQARMLMGG